MNIIIKINSEGIEDSISTEVIKTSIVCGDSTIIEHQNVLSPEIIQQILNHFYTNHNEL